MLKNSFKLCFFGIVLFTAGCSLTGPSPYPETTSYLLTGTHLTVAKASVKNNFLLISTIIANPPYNTTQMVYCDKPFTVNYFSKNKWANSPAEMLQPLVIQALQQTHRFKAVVTTPFSGTADLVLNLRLVKLQQNFIQQPSRIEFALHAELLNGKTQKIIAVHDFEINQITAEDTPYGGVVAANQGVDQLLQQLTMFVIRNN